MIISPKYGPQIDPTDGTCGKIQLVKRWVLVDGEGDMWEARQGQNTHTTREEAEARITLVRQNNRPGLYPESLTVAPRWCWPGHFDPAYPCEV